MILAAADRFVLFGPAHLTVLALAVIVPAALILWARLSASPAVTRGICWTLAIVLVVNEVGYWIYGIVNHGWYVYLESYLPLHLCGVGVVVTAWTLIRPNQIVFELAYYWGLAGTLQAVVTPDLTFGFPHYRFIEFFVNHGLIVTGVLFAVVGMRMRPQPGSVWRVFWLTNLYALAVGGADWLIGGDANYMYLRKRPETVNPLLFLEWPWYILFLEPVGLAIITVLYLPFRLTRANRRARQDFP